MKIAVKMILSYICLVVLFTALLVSVHFIPGKYLSKHIIQSADVIQKEGLYPNILNFKFFQLDNYTDALMLNIAASGKSEKPLFSAMYNEYYHSDDFFEMAVNAGKVANGETDSLKKTSYARYWHGYLVFLRPLLVISNYAQIRLFNYLALFTMFIVASWLIYKKISRQISVIFAASLLLLNFPIVPLSMQFSTVFYICFAATIYILLKREQLKQKDHFLILFFIIGSLTSFLDFLTVPIITLGIPVTIYLLSEGNRKAGKYPQIFSASATCGLGYGSVWASKWILSGMVTGANVFADAMEWQSIRTSGMYKGTNMNLANLFEFVSQSAEQKQLTALIYITPLLVLALVALYFYFSKEKREIIANLYLILIALMPIAWYLLLRNHSMEHGWMTWRALFVSLFAGLIFLHKTVSIEKIKLPFIRSHKG